MKVHILAVVASLCCFWTAIRAVEIGYCDASGPRVDCGRITRSDCESFGCCWSPVNERPDHAVVELPWCFYSNSEPALHNFKRDSGGNDGALRGEIVLERGAFDVVGADIPRLHFEATQWAPDIMRVRVTTPESDRWEVPDRLFPNNLLPPPPADAVPQLNVEATSTPFSFAVNRRGTRATLFNTTGHRLLFKGEYLELSSSIAPDSALYGLGERTVMAGLRAQRTGLPRTIWARDFGAAYPDANLYGSYPWYIQVNADGHAHGVLLLSSNAMDVVLDEDRISYRIVGGMMDLWFLAGPTPAAVMEQYSRIVGLPAMVPYWSLGFQQCRWGYKDVDDLERVINGYRDAAIPLEVLISDIDAMHGKRIFTLDPEHYPEASMRRFVDDLRKAGQKWIPIVDPGVKIDPGYDVYEDGVKENVFLKDVTGKDYVGSVWPGPVHYPDFMAPQTDAYWTRHVKAFHEAVPFDGLWIDMNEASNFCTGEVCRVPENFDFSFEVNALPPMAGNGTIDPSASCPLRCWTHQELEEALQEALANGGNASDPLLLPRGVDAATILDSLKDIPVPKYQVANSNAELPLGTNTIGLSVRGWTGDGPNAIQYNTHNLYGFAEARATYHALANSTGRRPFVLTRSSFPGTGSYAAHWTGDNAVTWNDLKWSISGVINSGLYGMPMAGSDICGFNGQPDRELCARWIGVGAFYPFSRNHHAIFAGEQELYLWPEVAEASRKVLSLRYSLLPYMYTAMYDAATKGCPAFRPLWFNFPVDQPSLDIDRQFMVGDALLISPVLDPGTSLVQAYFPPGEWYNLWEGDVTLEPIRSNDGVWKTLRAPLGEVPVHVAAGHVIATQAPRMTTEEVRNNPVNVIVAMPSTIAPKHPYTRCAAADLPDICRASNLRLASRRQLVDIVHGANESCKMCNPPVEEQDAKRMSRQDAAQPEAADVALACGRVYHDAGDSLEVRTDGQGVLTILAASTHTDGRHMGQLLLLHGRHGSYRAVADAHTYACMTSGNATQPPLGSLRVLGLPRGVTEEMEIVVAVHRIAYVPADVESDMEAGGQVVDLMLGQHVTEGGKVLVYQSRQLAQEEVWYDAETGELRVAALDEPMLCPTGLMVTWTLAGSAAGLQEA